MVRREINCEFQNYIMQPPIAPDVLQQHATSNDKVTLEFWNDKWLANIKSNHDKFGSFREKSIGNFYGAELYKPVIIAGSGPSLKYNAHKLKERGSICLVSCLHNFHLFEELDVNPEYYVTLDAGEVTIEEVYEGGTKDEEWYWERTKDRKLIAFIGTHPKLLEKWRGEIYFYNCPIPSDKFRTTVDEIETFHTWISNGGNVLGACMYFSMAYLGCSTTIFVGADFSFGYDEKFHAWDSKYDANKGYCVPVYDIFGHKINTWNSYRNFKYWFDGISLRVPHFFINATEGGCLGSYPEGNLITIKQMTFEAAMDMFHKHRWSKDQALTGEFKPMNETKLLF